MIEKIIFDKDLIKKIIDKNNVDLLFLKYDIKKKIAFYKTTETRIYKLILIEKILNA